MIAFLKLSAERIRRRSVSRLSCGSRPVLTSCCVMVATVVAGRETSTRTGLCRNCSVMRWISGGMVAEKNSVWRVNGTSLQMRSMSGMKPMSSMRSASSMTSSSTPVSSSRPRSKWSSRRPGVAISTSTPRVSLAVLIVERNAADDQRDVELVVGAVFVEAVLDLRGEFARRLEDERARHARPRAAVFEHGEHRQHEGGGLAGAGLRDAEHVAPREHVRDGLLLDRGGGGVAGRFDGGENFVGQAEIGKGHKTSSRDRPGAAPDTEQSTVNARRGRSNLQFVPLRAEHRVERAKVNAWRRFKLSSGLRFAADFRDGFVMHGPGLTEPGHDVAWPAQGAAGAFHRIRHPSLGVPHRASASCGEEEPCAPKSASWERDRPG